MSAVSVRDELPRPSRGLRSVGAARTTPTRLPGPRLLLPPVPTPTSPRPEDVVLLAPDARSVLRAPTEASWPVPGPATRPPGPLPDPVQLCGAVTLAAVEVLAGTRPLAQLTRWVTPGVLDQVATRFRRLAPARAQRAAQLAARPEGTTAPAPRARVRSVRVSRIGPTVAEGSVVLYDGERVRAAAVRLQVHRQAWRVSVLQIG